MDSHDSAWLEYGRSKTDRSSTDLPIGFDNYVTTNSSRRANVDVGGYSSAVVDPSGNEKQKVYSSEIEYIITKDSTKYVFDGAPVIAKDSIAGTVEGKQVSIRVAQVARAGTTEIDWVATATLVVSVGAVAMVITRWLGEVYAKAIPAGNIRL